MEMLADAGPTKGGRKATVIVVCCPAFTLRGNVNPLRVKKAEPVSVTSVMLKVAVPVFLMIRGMDKLVPTGSFPKLIGLTWIAGAGAGLTVSRVEPLMLPLVAEIVEVPAPTAVAKPVTLIVATVPVPEAHTALVSTCVELSLNVPVAANCCVAPLVIEGFAGVTAIDTSVAGFTWKLCLTGRAGA